MNLTYTDNNKAKGQRCHAVRAFPKLHYSLLGCDAGSLPRRPGKLAFPNLLTLVSFEPVPDGSTFCTLFHAIILCILSCASHC
jgi:hypothetical protein